MRIIKYLIFFVVVQLTFSQTNENKLFVIDYVGTYKKYNSQETTYKEYFRLMKRKDSSIFQSINEMTKDTILEEITKTKVYRKLPNTHHPYAIRYYKDSLVYWEKIFQVDYKYEEAINFDWKIQNKSKVISGYNCKLATVNYGGRLWSAWYAVEIPIDAGPYKFKGLPGLILQCYDEERNYQWDFFKLYKSDRELMFQKLYFSSNPEEIKKTTRTNFLKIQYSSKNATLSELNNSGASGFRVSIPNNNSTVRNSNTTSGRGYIPIELIE
ncbi:GLPGLI family protein [Nonlabens ulvanivorans]|uniref:GLPGLI family protein n=1 Tax=Nonlabens ulvanivorans TaxID=906888 RepID=A0A084JY89_NONUL|nr:GLPGLI family protein [Nonlabens ulvanivorans]KEZ93923.1 hypothetical protein IL45_06935 [Nonlabens ulvanivorans]PRX14537.1 GLPGLI family protein [Nonlabens ulvanivorans]